MENDRIAKLYPHVHDTPLPRSWSSKDKYQYIKLSRSNQRVHYNGQGKNHKDAASVRSTHPIPAACGVYYFEVKIISKGRDGYMGIGLADGKVNMNRLPGWEDKSYGYHGDDGHSFCSSGNGQPYGPTFTTGDVIGCCVNMINCTCFYTKNGVNLGTAFDNIPLNLYPTVGLQSPGEIADANFGDHPFVFDIEGYMAEWRCKLHKQIDNHPVTLGSGEMEAVLKKLIFGYMVHHGYCGSSEAFAKSTNLSFFEDIPSIQNRQKLQKLVLSGKVGDAISLTRELYPTLLVQNPHLLFKLQIRHFIEMIALLDSTPPHSHPYSIASIMNGNEEEEKMDVDTNTEASAEEVRPSRHALEQLLLFGRDLQAQSVQLGEQQDDLKKQLQDAFSLLAYKDPRQSPLGHLLNANQREALCADLNSAILESHGLPRQPPLELAISQTKNSVERMLQSGLGAGAYSGLDKFLNCTLKPQ